MAGHLSYEDSIKNVYKGLVLLAVVTLVEVFLSLLGKGYIIPGAEEYQVLDLYCWSGHHWPISLQGLLYRLRIHAYAVRDKGISLNGTFADASPGMGGYCLFPGRR